MNSGTRFSPIWLFALIVGVAAIGAALYVPSREKESLQARLREAKQKQTQSAMALNGLKEYDQLNLEKARSRAESFRTTLLTPAQEKSLLMDMQLKHGWKVTDNGAKPNVEYVRTVFTLSRVGAAIGEWPAILESIETLSKNRGLRFRSISIHASPDEARPVFTRIELKVDLFTKAQNTP